MSGCRTLRFRITGASPLLTYNGQLVDPLNPRAKAMAQVADKRRKMEANHLRLGELEFYGSLYLRDSKPRIPDETMKAALVRAAAQERCGPKAKAGLLVRNDLALLHEGPTETAALWESESFALRSPVRVGTSKIMRTRPMFRDWAAELSVDFLPTLLNPQDVRSFLVTVGEQIGIDDWRPRFRRFWVEETSTASRQALRDQRGDKGRQVRHCSGYRPGTVATVCSRQGKAWQG